MEHIKNTADHVTAKIGRTQYQTIVTGGKHTIIADEPETAGGMDTGMAPYHLLLASLASCTLITLRMYIDRKMWVIDEVIINAVLSKTEDGERIESKLSFTGEVTDVQKQRLISIAGACPVHKLLSKCITINTSLLV